jgi:hypothetical protein
LEFHIILAGWEQLGSIGIEERWAEFHVIDFTTLTLFHLDLKMGGGSSWSMASQPLGFARTGRNGPRKHHE